jgi:hypothetical protein
MPAPLKGTDTAELLNERPHQKEKESETERERILEEAAAQESHNNHSD